MQPKRLPQKDRYKLAAQFEKSLTGEGYEKKPGLCLRKIRVDLEECNVPEEMRVPYGQSARSMFKIYEKRGYVMPVGTRPQIGDILFKVADGDGKAGHVGGKFAANKIGENSSAHWTEENQDARGWRTERNYKGARVVRLWES